MQGHEGIGVLKIEGVMNLPSQKWPNFVPMLIALDSRYTPEESLVRRACGDVISLKIPATHAPTSHAWPSVTHIVETAVVEEYDSVALRFLDQLPWRPLFIA